MFDGETAGSPYSGDGLSNADDACPALAGVPEESGCPPPGVPAIGGIAGLLDADDAASTVDAGGKATIGYVAALVLVGAALIAGS